VRKVWTVAVREYRVTLRTKTFVIAMLLMPVFMGGSIGVQLFLEGKVGVDTKRVAVVDSSGKMFPVLAQAAEERNKDAIDPKTGKPTRSLYELHEIVPDADHAEQQLLKLSQRIRDKELFAILVIDAEVLQGDADPGASAPTAESRPPIRYYSNQPTYFELRYWLQEIISSRVQRVRLTLAQIDPDLVARAMQPVAIENLGLLDVDASGKIQEGQKVNEGVAFGVPFALIMLMFMALAMTTQPLLNGILEEKMNRIAEVLLGSVPPFDLMLGKLIGYVGIAVTLVAVYLVGGYVVADYYGYADVVPVHLLAWFLVFQCLAIFMFGAMFLAIGACCNDFREAQNLMLPVWLVLCIPLFALGPVIQNPDSGFATLLSLIPPATPMLMIARMAIPPGVPLWQPIVGIVGTLLTTILCVFAASRVFRVGLLFQGKPPTIADLARWVIRG